MAHGIPFQDYIYGRYVLAEGSGEVSEQFFPILWTSSGEVWRSFVTAKEFGYVLDHTCHTFMIHHCFIYIHIHLVQSWTLESEDDPVHQQLLFRKRLCKSSAATWPKATLGGAWFGNTTPVGLDVQALNPNRKKHLKKGLVYQEITGEAEPPEIIKATNFLHQATTLPPA